jgi:hypothetical protein
MSRYFVLTPVAIGRPESKQLAMLDRIKPGQKQVGFEPDVKATELADLMPNSSRAFPVSARVQEVLKLEKKIAFQPIRIADHQGKVVASDYALADFKRVLDCVDRKKSVFDDDMPGWFDKLVLDPKKIPGDAYAFRLSLAKELVIVDQELRDALAALKPRGVCCVPVEDFASHFELRGYPPLKGGPITKPERAKKAKPVKVKTRFKPGMPSSAAIDGLTEAYAGVIAGEAAGDLPVKALALGVTDQGRPILRITTRSGRETNFGYLWSFECGEALSDQLEELEVKRSWLKGLAVRLRKQRELVARDCEITLHDDWDS